MRRFAFMAVLLLGTLVVVTTAAAENVTNTYTGEGDALTFPATMDNGAAITYGAANITFETRGPGAAFEFQPDAVDLPTDGTMGNGDFELAMDLAMTDLDGVSGWYSQGIQVSFGAAADSSMSIEWTQFSMDALGAEEDKCVRVNAFDDTLGPSIAFIPAMLINITSTAEVCGLEGAGAGNISLRLSLLGNILTASYKPAGGDWTEAYSVDLGAAGPDPAGGWTLSVVNWGYDGTSYLATSHVVDEISVTFGDLTPPAIALLGDESICIIEGDAYVDPGATATDDEDGDLTAAIVVDGDPVDTNAVGTYEVTYDVADAAGNAADTVTREVVVDPDCSDDPPAGAVTNTYTGQGDALTFPDTMDNGSPITYGADTITFDTRGADAGWNFLPDAVNLPTDGTMGNGDFELTTDLAMTDLDGAAGWYGQGIRVSFGTAADSSMSIEWTQFSVNYDDLEETKCVRVNAFDDTLGASLTGITATAEVCGLESAGAGNISLRLSLSGDTLTASYKPAGGDWTEAHSVDMSVTGPDPTSIWTPSVVNWGIDGGPAFGPTSHVVDEISVTFTPVSGDITPPVITLVGDETICINQGSAYVDPGATAADNEDGDLTAAIVVGGDPVDTNAVGTYDVTYDVEDAAGNAASTVTRSVLVETDCNADTTPPVIALSGDTTICIIEGGAYVDPGATATDDEDGDLTAAIDVGGDAVDTNVAGTYAVTYDVADAAGNAADTVTRYVEVDPDCSDDPPAGAVTNTYTGQGDALTFPATMDNGAAITYGDSNITFETRGTNAAYEILPDAVDLPTDGTMGVGDFELTMKLAMTDLDGVVGWYGQGIRVSFGTAADSSMSIQWAQFSNDAGNVIEEKCVHVWAFDDTLVPDFVTGMNSTTAACGLEGPGAGNISLRLSLSGNILTASYKPAGGDWTEVHTVNMGATGPDPTSIWTLSVVNGGYAYYGGVDFRATSNVVDEISVTYTPAGGDLTAPVITLLGDDIIYISKGGAYADPGATAADNEDGDLTAAIVVGGDSVNTNVVGTYERTYDVQDVAGNTAQTMTRHVVVDPVFTDETDACFIDSISADSNQPPYAFVLAGLMVSILIFLFGQADREKETDHMKRRPNV